MHNDEKSLEEQKIDEMIENLKKTKIKDMTPEMEQKLRNGVKILLNLSTVAKSKPIPKQKFQVYFFDIFVILQYNEGVQLYVNQSCQKLS